MGRAEHGGERRLDRTAGIGEERGHPGQGLVGFGVEDMQNRADEERMGGLLPMVPPLQLALGVDQNWKDMSSNALADAIRRVARGGRAIAPELAEAAWDAPPNPLTDRERDALRLADEGRSNKDIARTLDLSPGTVRNYLSDASSKLGAANRIEAARIARDRGWL